jgi:hypothetical protein
VLAVTDWRLQSQEQALLAQVVAVAVLSAPDLTMMPEDREVLAVVATVATARTEQ